MLKASLIGNLGNEPDMRYAASGSPMLRFNVASNYRTRTPEGEYRDRTEWVRVTVTGSRAGTLSQYLKKGSRVYVEGRLEARPWTDRAGNVQAGLEVLANDVQFMSARQADDGDDTARVSSADERSARRMPQEMAVTGVRGGGEAADRDDEAGDPPF